MKGRENGMLVFRDDKNDLIVLRGTGEKRLYLESTFYRHLADCINAKLGTDMIPKEMYKDHHLVDRGRFYLVDRERRYAFVQNDWATYDVNRDYFNKGVPLELRPCMLQETGDDIASFGFLDALPTWETTCFHDADGREMTEIIVNMPNGTVYMVKKPEYRIAVEAFVDYYCRKEGLVA